MLLNDEADIPTDWRAPDRSDLWNYHLHYFDDLNAKSADARVLWHRDLITSWIRANPPRVGIGWDAYPTALRIVNWVKWGLRHDLPLEAHQSIALQARTLASSLEYHLLANHLFADAKGLFFAGLWFGGEEGDRWLHRGRNLLAEQISEQILGDGGHYERSPMYHQTILVDLLDIDAACQGWAVLPPTGLGAAICRMRTWAAAMAHPDGDIAFFNDACLGAAPSPAAVEHQLSSVKRPEPNAIPEGLLAESGFYRLQTGPLNLLMDVGNIAPAYQPGHAHAGSLSIEVSAFGRRVFVNSGTSLYGRSAERLRQRGTAAHNTLAIGQHNSSDVWSGFRVGKRARVDLLSSGRRAVKASHNGYLFLGARHTREVTGTETALTIEDSLEGDEAIVGTVRWFLHPEVCVERDGDRGCRLNIVDGGRLHLATSNPLRIVDSTWHPRQGVVLDNKCLEIEVLRNNPLLSTLTWTEPNLD